MTTRTDGVSDPADGDALALPSPSSHYQGIDWTLVQHAHGEAGFGRVNP